MEISKNKLAKIENHLSEALNTLKSYFEATQRDALVSGFEMRKELLAVAFDVYNALDIIDGELERLPPWQ